MKRLFDVLEVVHDSVVRKDWDCPLIIAGDEGKGKSHLNLHLLEKWYSLRGISITSELIEHINLDIVKWAEDLKECKRYDCSIWDEGGSLSNKRSMSKLNYIISRAFQIIRGDNLLSVLTIPSVFDLDGFFTKRRAKGLIQVYSRGRFAFWSQQRLRAVISLNQNRMVKNPWVVQPTFYDTFPKYKGILLDAYNNKKKEYMKDIRKNLYDDIKSMEASEGFGSERDKLVVKFHQKFGTSAVAEATGLTDRRIQQIVKTYSEKRRGET